MKLLPPPEDEPVDRIDRALAWVGVIVLGCVTGWALSFLFK
jgi:hypothetical protein